MANDKAQHRAKIEEAIGALFDRGQLVEVRVRLRAGSWRGFYFNDHVRMAEVVRDLDRDARVVAVYHVFNGIKKTIVEGRKQCACEKCKQGGLIVLDPNDKAINEILNGPAQHLTGNDDINNLNWLFIDVDTSREVGFEHESATAAEKKASKAVGNEIIRFLDGMKWPAPLLADSGNGFHILNRINLPNTQGNVSLLMDCLRALGARFTCPAATIDNSVFNPARLTRAYGTTTRKGTHSQERPHRRNRLLVPRDRIKSVTLDQILTLAGEAPAPELAKGKRMAGMPTLHEDFDPGDFFDWYGDQEAFTITGSRTWQGHEVMVTDHCIISGTKHTGSQLSGFIVGDTFGYHCWSPECNDPSIGDVLRKLKEDGYDSYPRPIWVVGNAILDFAEDVQALEDAVAQTAGTPDSAADLQVSEARPEGEPPIRSSEQPERTPEDPRSERGAQPIGGEPVAMAADLIAILLDDTSDDARGNFIMYRKRLDQVAPYLDAPVGDTMMRLVWYERALKKLPTKTELKDYVHRHPDCAETRAGRKEEICGFIDGLQRNPAKTLDVTAIAMLDEINFRLEKIALKKAWGKLKNERDIPGERIILRKHWATSTSLDSGFRSDPWQLRQEEIYQSFERDVMGTDDRRKFETGFPSIDSSGMNIGLDGEHAIVLYGPASNRKTTLALSLALNFSMRGKHGLYIAGEHQTMRVLKSLTLMLSHFLKKEVGEVPGLGQWEGLRRNATLADLEKIKRVLTKLSLMEIVPGYLEVQNTHALTRGEDDKLGAIMGYAEATHKKFQWDYIVIDPLDSIMPPDDGSKGGNWKACSTIVDRLFDYSRSYAGDRGIMVVTTAQFGAPAAREIARIQAKNGGSDNYDDEIEATLRRDSLIQYFTTISQRFDLGIGVATREKNGHEGMLVQGRTRGGGHFDVAQFVVGAKTNYLREKNYKPMEVEVRMNVNLGETL